MNPPNYFQKMMLSLGLRVWKCRTCRQAVDPRSGKAAYCEQMRPCPLVHVWRWQTVP